jgi:hypothetical protein
MSIKYLGCSLKEQHEATQAEQLRSEVITKLEPPDHRINQYLTILNIKYFASS